jgi:hypothetical protein
MIINLEVLCSRLITGTAWYHMPCREVPKHRDNNVCSRIVTGAALYYKWRWEEPKHRNYNERCTELRSDLERLRTQSRSGKRKTFQMKNNEFVIKKHVFFGF